MKNVGTALLPIVLDKTDRICKRHQFLKSTNTNYCGHVNPESNTLCKYIKGKNMEYCDYHVKFSNSCKETRCMGILKCGCRCTNKHMPNGTLCKMCENHILFNSYKYNQIYFRSPILTFNDNIVKCIDNSSKHTIEKYRTLNYIAHIICDYFSTEIVFKILNYLSIYDIYNFIDYNIEPFLDCIQENFTDIILIDKCKKLDIYYDCLDLKSNLINSEKIIFSRFSYNTLLKYYMDKYFKEIKTDYRNNLFPNFKKSKANNIFKQKLFSMCT